MWKGRRREEGRERDVFVVGLPMESDIWFRDTGVLGFPRII